MAKNKLRANRAKLIRALPYALWRSDATQTFKTKPSVRMCMACKQKAVNPNVLCISHDIYWPIREDTLGHYLAIALTSEDKVSDKVSYASKELHRQDEGARVKTSFARYVRRQLGITAEQLTDDTLAAMQARLIAVTKTELDAGTVRILRGDELREAYKNSIGLASCMTGAERQPLLELYINNPDYVGLLVFQPSKTGPVYRALLWELADGKQLLDRIYPADNSAAFEQLTRWARNNKIYTHYDRTPSTAVPIVRLPVGKAKKYPYLDTFRWGRWDTDNVALFLRTSEPHLTEAQRVKDWPLYFSENKMLDLRNKPVPCARCHKGFPASELVMGKDSKGYCEACAKLNWPVCPECGVQQWYLDMDSILVWKNGDSERVPACKSCVKNAGAKCQHCEETWLRKDLLPSGLDRHCSKYVGVDAK